MKVVHKLMMAVPEIGILAMSNPQLKFGATGSRVKFLNSCVNLSENYAKCVIGV